MGINMKILHIIITILLLSSNSFGQTTLRVLEQKAFKRGEVLKYTASYGLVNAANAVLTVTNENKLINGRSTYHVIGTGKSLGAFNWFFKVDDRYESFMDEKALVPWVFLRRVHEGGFVLKRNIYFNQEKQTLRVKSLKDSTVKDFKAEPNVQDLLSAFYYARTLDLQRAKKDTIFTIMTFFDYEHYPMKIKFRGREQIKTDLGSFNCLKFTPMLQEGRVFKEQEDMTIWLSDDQNKVPIRLQTNLLVGSIKLDLQGYENLMVPLNEIKKN